MRLDGRNVLHVPSEWLRAHHGAWEPRLAAGQLLLVNESTIMRLWPCCAPGGPCCPDGPVPLNEAWTPANGGVSCCTRRQIDRAFSRHPLTTSCEAALNAWCRGNCHLAASSELFARFNLLGRKEWRCYAAETLDANRTRHVSGRAFCSRDQQLRRGFIEHCGERDSGLAAIVHSDS